MFLNSKLKLFINTDLSAPTQTKEDLEHIINIRRRLLSNPEPDSEWGTGIQKICKLSGDPENWMHAEEIMEPPTGIFHKIGDEARSIAARHIIDRLKEKGLLDAIGVHTPRLRSSVELLSKPDADILYPAVQFVVNQMLEKYPETYSSVIKKVHLRIPQDEEPSNLLALLARSVLEDSNGQVKMTWCKFIAVLVLGGALAIDCVESGYPRGIIAIVETFGCIVEQFMAEWIMSPGTGGWDGLIKETTYQAMLPPFVRALLILTFVYFLINTSLPYLEPLWSPLADWIWEFFEGTNYTGEEENRRSIEL